jgi:hypothetical protein
LQDLSQPPGQVEGDVLLAQAAGADRSGLDPAVAGVDDDDPLALVTLGGPGGRSLGANPLQVDHQPQRVAQLEVGVAAITGTHVEDEHPVVLDTEAGQDRVVELLAARFGHHPAAVDDLDTPLGLTNRIGDVLRVVQDDPGAGLGDVAGDLDHRRLGVGRHRHQQRHARQGEQQTGRSVR